MAQAQPRMPTPEEQRLVKDLCNKAIGDVHVALKTPMGLINEAAGSAGMFIMAQKLAGTFVVAAAMTMKSARDGNSYLREKSVTDIQRSRVIEDDILFCGLLSVTMEKFGGTGQQAIEEAQDMFFKIKGRKHDVPFA